MRDRSGGAAPSRSGALVVNRGVSIVGALTVEGDVHIEGTVDGDIRCGALQIAERGIVEGLIVANRVVVLGEFVGMIYARELVLGAGCAVEGQIYHHTLVLEEGCYFEGKSRRHGDPLRIAPLPETRDSLADSLREHVA
jgi:cytoskeletal protein CcmA (bactofilin family)